jgi:hypothetical protein
LLAVLATADTFLDAYGKIYEDLNDTETIYGLNATNWGRNVHMAYITTFSAVALEMCAWAVFIFLESRSTNTQSRVSQAKPERKVTTAHKVLIIPLFRKSRSPSTS